MGVYEMSSFGFTFSWLPRLRLAFSRSVFNLKYLQCRHNILPKPELDVSYTALIYMRAEFQEAEAQAEAEASHSVTDALCLPK